MKYLAKLEIIGMTVMLVGITALMTGALPGL